MSEAKVAKLSVRALVLGLSSIVIGVAPLVASLFGEGDLYLGSFFCSGFFITATCNVFAVISAIAAFRLARKSDVTMSSSSKACAVTGLILGILGMGWTILYFLVSGLFLGGVGPT